MTDKGKYRFAHALLKKIRGVARENVCAHCMIYQARHWAFDWTVSNPPRDHQYRPYSLDTNRYVALCARCHSALDRAAVEAIREQV